MVTLYRSPTVSSEIEAQVIRGILDSHGIPSLMLRAMGNPQLGFEVQVHRQDFRESERLIEEARAAGPGAAWDAELASETAVKPRTGLKSRVKGAEAAICDNPLVQPHHPGPLLQYLPSVAGAGEIYYFYPDDSVFDWLA
ncbi:MAG: DUF2007 domain-containing protein [Ignavibacteriota bacterium]